MGTAHPAVSPALAATDCVTWAKSLHGEKVFQSQTAALGDGEEKHTQHGALAEYRAPWLLTLEAVVGFSCVPRRLRKDGNQRELGHLLGVPSSPRVKLLGTVRLILKHGVQAAHSSVRRAGRVAPVWPAC